MRVPEDEEGAERDTAFAPNGDRAPTQPDENLASSGAMGRISMTLSSSVLGPGGFLVIVPPWLSAAYA